VFFIIWHCVENGFTNMQSLEGEMSHWVMIHQTRLLHVVKSNPYWRMEEEELFEVRCISYAWFETWFLLVQWVMKDCLWERVLLNWRLMKFRYLLVFWVMHFQGHYLCIYVWVCAIIYFCIVYFYKNMSH